MLKKGMEKQCAMLDGAPRVELVREWLNKSYATLFPVRELIS
jgi:hypothetical protein